MKTIAELSAEAADELRECAFAPDDLRTAHLRRVANLFVDIRELCTDPAGRGKDYTGRSKEYREAVSAVYRDVEDEVPPVRLRQMKSQVRYHFSTIVRERLRNDPELLDVYGLQEKSVKARNHNRIKQRRALEAAGVLEREADTPNATARLVHGARYLLDLAVEEGTDEANQEARDYIRTGVRQIVSRAPELVPPEDRVELARELLAGVPPEAVRHKTVTVEGTRNLIDDLLEQARGRRRSREVS